jgi:hypothetical protein
VGSTSDLDPAACRRGEVWTRKEEMAAAEGEVRSVRSGAGSLGPVQFFFFQNDTAAIFVVIRQLVFNHGLISLKRFVSFISSKLCN